MKRLSDPKHDNLMLSGKVLSYVFTGIWLQSQAGGVLVIFNSNSNSILILN